MDEDHLMINRILQGDQDAYSHIIAKFQNPIYVTAYRMVGDAEEAKDIAQETFIKAYYKLESYRFSTKFSSWLYRIAINLCIDALRKRTKLQTVPVDQVIMQHQETPEKVFLKHDDAHAIQQLVQSLPEEYRVVFVLRHYNQLSYQEISDTLAIPMATVQNRLHRSRKMIREKLSSTNKEGVGL